MLKIFNKTKAKKGQNVAEYAILIALVVGAVVAMQRFAQRGLQARIRDATQWMVRETVDLGNTAQYEPYYSQSAYQTERTSEEFRGFDAGEAESLGTSRTTRRAADPEGKTGISRTAYDTAQKVEGGMTFDVQQP